MDGRRLSKPGVRPYRADYPVRPSHTGPDPVVNAILSQEGGFKRYISVIAAPGTFVPLDMDTTGRNARSTTTDPPPKSPHELPTFVDFYTLGPGLRGVPNTIHGGIIALLVDTTGGKCGYMHRGAGLQTYTSYSNTRFLKPIVTDENGYVDLAVKAQVSARRSEGPRMTVLVRLEGDGVVYATGEVGVVVVSAWRGRI